jgi:two-component system, sensor histidine kinase and response regulator
MANAFGSGTRRGRKMDQSAPATPSTDFGGEPVAPATPAVARGQWLHGSAVTDKEASVCDNELSRALLAVPGLDVGHVWRRSAERLADYCRQLRRFLSLHGQDMTQLRRLVTAGDREAAHILAHQLKGIAGMIGAWQVASLANEIGQGLHSGADDAIIICMAAHCELALASIMEAVESLPGLAGDSVAA